jgi:3-phosphoshikimate 1-carboxyvinyltransferase
MIVHIQPSTVSGRVLIPASKSHTVRALLIASMAEGTSRIANPLVSNDTLSCAETCRIFGATVDVGEGLWAVKGTGGRIDQGTVDVGNSGTTLYLAAGLAALGDKPVVFTGDDQIRRRPIEPLLRSLRDLGADARSELGNGCAPITVRGPMHGGRISIECPTSQYLSSLLIAAPLATAILR